MRLSNSISRARIVARLHPARVLAVFSIIFLIDANTPQAQVLRVYARDSVTAAPMSNALLEVIGIEGEVVLTTTTGSNGQRTIKLPANGPYRVRLRNIGFRPTTSDSFVATTADTIRLDLRVAMTPVVLSSISVLDESQCDLSHVHEDGRRIVTLWEQLQTGLQLADVEDNERHVDSSEPAFRAYVTRLSADDHRVLRHTVMRSRETGDVRFATFSSADITARGYVRHDTGGATYVAPSAQVLLSDAFETQHCFHLITGRGPQSGLVGLAFTPIPSRKVPEIAGTLWADSTNGTPRYAEYWFVDDRIPGQLRGAGKSGGEVYFGVLTNGNWAVTGWSLRMPQVVRTASMPPTSQLRLLEAGAISTHSEGATTAAYETVIKRFEPGAIDAVVRDSLKPLARAQLSIRQRPDSAATLLQLAGVATASQRTTVAMADTIVFTDNAGRVTVGGLAPGTYEVKFTHAAVVHAGVEPQTIDVVVAPGASTQVVLNVAYLNKDVRGECARPSGGTGVYGVVHKGEGTLEPFAFIASANITARWTDINAKAHERRAESDGNGQFAMCRLPDDVPISLTFVEMRTELELAAGSTTRTLATAEVTVHLRDWKFAFLPVTMTVHLPGER